MQANERQERATQAVAWLCVVAVHAGLLWLLVQPLSRGPADRGEQVRLRLVFLEPIRQPSPAVVAPLAPVATARALSARTVSQSDLLPRSAASATEPTSNSAVSAAELLEQGRQWAREQSPPGFQPTPLRSRRAQLPGGDRADAFRMRPPPSPKRVMDAIARAFGDPGPPCPRIQSNIAGLLAATSERERGLLQEELRRDRELCRP
ncbi:MAG: hypothetical protein ACREO7_08720 [Pseudoxanthomonas sp.]